MNACFMNEIIILLLISPHTVAVVVKGIRDYGGTWIHTRNILLFVLFLKVLPND